MFETIEYLTDGNNRQREAYHAITELGLMKELAEYTPILCGTIPLEIDVEGSDLDIIMAVEDFLGDTNGIY